MLRKDWMKVRFKKLFENKLLLVVYYGLFVGDIEVFLFVENLLFLKIYDIIDVNVRCVYFYLCLMILYGICYFGESMDKVYVFFDIYVEYYEIVVIEKVLI